MKILIILVSIVLLSACQANNNSDVSRLQDDLRQKNNEIEELYKTIEFMLENFDSQIAALYNEIEMLKNTNNNTISRNIRTSPIAETYEEALEIMNGLGIENVVLERLIIKGETFTVIEVIESYITVGLDGVVNIYDIPDESGNVIRIISSRNEIQARILGISEESYQLSYGNRSEQWVKIRMDDHYVGWVRGENTSIEMGGPKYYTRRTSWMWENFSSFFM